jgi:hypothetical protein
MENLIVPMEKMNICAFVEGVRIQMEVCTQTREEVPVQVSREIHAQVRRAVHVQARREVPVQVNREVHAQVSMEAKTQVLVPCPFLMNRIARERNNMSKKQGNICSCHGSPRLKTIKMQLLFFIRKHVRHCRKI